MQQSVVSDIALTVPLLPGPEQEQAAGRSSTGQKQPPPGLKVALALTGVFTLATLFVLVALHRQPPASPVLQLRRAAECTGPYDCDYLGRPRQVQTEGGVVAADQGNCAAIGAAALAEGGHAVDAAVATALCQGVLNPFASGLGGGTFMLIRQASGDAEFIDAREQAPSAAAYDMFEGLPPSASLDGGLAIAIPLELKGLEVAWQKYGRLPWASLVAPAAHLARTGFPMHPYLRFILSGPFTLGRMKESPLLRAAFLLPDGDGWRLPEIGEWCCQRTTLADTLDRVAEEGAEGLYSDANARAMAQEIQDAAGVVTAADFHLAEPQVFKPLHHKVGELEFVLPPPPSSASAVTLAFEILHGFSDTPTPLLRSHRLAEAMKHVFAARTSMGDPSFCDISAVLDDMLDRDFADLLRRSIDDTRTLDPYCYGGPWNPSNLPGGPWPVMPTDHGTSHISVMDNEGNAVTMTTTVNTALGSGVMSESTGIIFNNEMDDFTQPVAGRSGFCGPYEANYIEPLKRPMSSMSPMMVLRRGELHMVLGASGGTHIVTAVLQVLARVLLDEQPLLDAVSAPRFHAQWEPSAVQYENYTFDAMRFGVPAETVEYLEDKGQEMRRYGDQLGAVQAIVINAQGVRTAVSDPRKDGAPAAARGRL